MLIVFRYPDSTDKPGSNGFNKIGYITTGGTAIFTIRNNVVRKNLVEIKKLPHQLAQLTQYPESFDRKNLDIFFWKTIKRPISSTLAWHR